MNKKNKKSISGFEHYLTVEIGIEFKACLYFFCILLYYSMYRLANGNTQASILHMAEMIFLTYVMGYLQFYVLSNFDEGDSLTPKSFLYLTVCSFLYAAVSYGAGWFDRNIWLSAGFLFYMMFAFVCAFLIYKLKRDIDGKILNEELKAFQERKENDESCD